MTEKKRSNLIIIASQAFRGDPASPFLQFVRANAHRLKRYQIHATGGTARCLLSTGMFTSTSDQVAPFVGDAGDIVVHRYGREGGVVELASMVPRGMCAAVMFFLDPADRFSEVPENRALQRVCKDLGAKLISTLPTARYWLVSNWSESQATTKQHEVARMWYDKVVRLPVNVDSELGNVEYLESPQQTIALIAHDRMKDDMVLFVSTHRALLRTYKQILTTGTTGYVLKLIFTPKDAQSTVCKQAWGDLGPVRYDDFLIGAARTLKVLDSLSALRVDRKKTSASVEDTIKRWFQFETESSSDLYQRYRKGTLRDIIYQKHPQTAPLRLQGYPDIRTDIGEADKALADKILPAPSGPKGGDILLADAVLQHRCHVAVFFQDTGNPHGHEPDIRLFERTTHFWSSAEPSMRVNIVCLSDPDSAHTWARSMANNANELVRPCSREETLRQRFGLRDLVCTDGPLDELHNDVPPNEDGADLGKTLAEGAAHYLMQEIRFRSRSQREVTVGVGHGWLLKQAIQIISVAGEQFDNVRCIPVVGNLSPYPRDQQAEALARELARHIGGHADQAFRASGFHHPSPVSTLAPDDEMLLANLESADVVIVAAGVWREGEKLHKFMMANKDLEEVAEGQMPAVGDVAGHIGTEFIDHKGQAVPRAMRFVGLSIAGMTKVCQRGTVILVAGGVGRNPLIKAVLKEKYVSVLMTTRGSAMYLEGLS